MVIVTGWGATVVRWSLAYMVGFLVWERAMI